MNKTALVLCLSLLAAPLAANAQMIDGSSDEAFEKSIKQMVDKLGEEEKEAFSQAMIRMMLERYPPATGADGLAALSFLPKAIEAAPRTMNGVTYEEIRAEMAHGGAGSAEGAAEKERAAEEQRRREANGAAEKERAAAAERRAEAERAEEEQRQARAAERDPLAPPLAGPTAGREDENPNQKAAELACLKEKVTLANVRIEPASYGRLVRVDVRNDLPWAIAGIVMEVIVTTPGRSVPWGKDRNPVSIAGGIEPGETREVRSSINLSSDTPEDVEGTATIIDVSDPQERLLVGGVSVMGWPAEPSPMNCLKDQDSTRHSTAARSSSLERIPAMIRPCWNQGALPSGATGMRLDVAFDVAEGKLDPDSLRIIGRSGDSTDSAETAFQVARRAIFMCSQNGYDSAYSGTVQMSFGPEGDLALIE